MKTALANHRAILGGALIVATAALGACAGDPEPFNPSGTTGSSVGTQSGPSSGSAGEGGSTGSGEGGSSGSSNPTSSGTTNPTGSGVSAHDMFVDEVFPLLDAPSDNGMACTACHATGAAGSPVFLTTNAEGSYNAIIAYTPSMIAIPDNSNLVLHGPHAGPALDADQLAAVEAWLEKEVEERDLDGGGDGGGSGEGGGDTGAGGSGPVDPPLTLALALEQFGDCMDYTQWMETGMINLPEAQTEIGPCQGCHNAGDGGAWLSANDEETYARNRTYPYVKRLVTGTVDENGAFDTLIPARRFIEKGNEGCDPQIQNCHPEFVLPPDIEQAVVDFVDLTLERWELGECEPVDPGGEGGGGGDGI
jgi:hypothetical protein